MTLTDLPEDVAALTMAQPARLRRKRPRSDGRRDSETRTSPRVPIPPIQVDHDLLVQVVRVKVQTLIRTASLREHGLQQQDEAESNQQHHPRCTAERLERLIPVIEQRWLQDLMRGDEPRYGFDEVVQALRGVVHNDSDTDDASQQKQKL
jgi:hypothetical protein